jgi:hypothetical protein
MWEGNNVCISKGVHQAKKSRNVYADQRAAATEIISNSGEQGNSTPRTKRRRIIQGPGRLPSATRSMLGSRHLVFAARRSVAGSFIGCYPGLSLAFRLPSNHDVDILANTLCLLNICMWPQLRMKCETAPSLCGKARVV